MKGTVKTSEIVKIIGTVLDGVEELLFGAMTQTVAMRQILDRNERGETLPSDLIAHYRTECAGVEALHAASVSALAKMHTKLGIRKPLIH
jgi:hypothetical protein